MPRPKWYLKSIQTKKNREWSNADKHRIYTLRERKMPVTLIAHKYGAHVIQIYNIIRIMRQAAKKQCFICGHKLTPEELDKNKKRLIKACDLCKKKSQLYKKKRRKRVLKQGLCGYCETKKALPGQSSCKKCISATYRRRYKQGLCGRCGRYPIKEGVTTQCYSCNEESNKKARDRDLSKKHEKVKV